MDNFVGEIKAFSFGYLPEGWLPCNGAVLSIQQYTTLYAVIAGTYNTANVNPSQSFCVPNLTGVVPMGVQGSSGYGQTGGVETVALNYGQMPLHTHTLQVVNRKSTSALVNTPGANTYVTDGSSVSTTPVNPEYIFSTQASSLTMNSGMIANTGNSAPHENRMPYLAMTFGICFEGIFPQRP